MFHNTSGEESDAFVRIARLSLNDGLVHISNRYANYSIKCAPLAPLDEAKDAMLIALGNLSFSNSASSYAGFTYI